MKHFFSLVIFLSIGLFAQAQIKSYQDQIKSELAARGIDEKELQDALLAKGISIVDPAKLSSAEIKVLQETIEEIYRLKTPTSLSRTNSTSTDSTSTPDPEALEKLPPAPDVKPIDQDSSKIKIFGFHLFQQPNFSPLEVQSGFVPPLDYIIGTGDVLAVSIFGPSQLDESYTVEQDGSIRILDRRVKIQIAGISLSDARLKLVSNFKRYYRFSDSQFNLNLAGVRQVRIQIFGEVIKPGDYTFSGLNHIVNALNIAGGLTPNASIRNIQLVKHNGKTLNFDIYQLLIKPEYKNQYVIENGDFLFVPAANNVVEISGAINRPMSYELKDADGLTELIEYAGGLNASAFLTTMRLSRYEEDKKTIKTIPYGSLVKEKDNFGLNHGDNIEVSFIKDKLENYVTVMGEVRNEGIFELTASLKLKELLDLAGIKPSSKLDFSFLKRSNKDGSISWIPISLEDVINGVGPASVLELQDRDEITVWAQERFTDNQFVSISGAVRFPERIPFDKAGSLRLSDMIRMSGGLQRDAANFAHVHRLDPLNPNKLSYVRIDLDQVFSNANNADNIYVEPYDSIYIYSKTEFLDEVYIKISGAVNNPGEFAYGEGMTLSDLVILAGGFRRSSATNDIEVSRVIIRDNLPTKTIVERVSIDRSNYLNNKSEGAFVLEPYDNVFVRYVPEFELQQNVTIVGEVIFPGEYSLITENETVTELLNRAGGLTEEAFPEAATLFRYEDSLGYIIMRMEEAIQNPLSKYNYKLKNGDVIKIPKKIDYVSIVGATQYLLQNDLKQVNVPFTKGEDALFYINTFAGGFSDEARTDKIFVKYPNGEVKTTEKRFLLGKKHPEVLPGSEIQVGRIKIDPTSGKEEQNLNWTKVLGDSVAQAMSILTLILLVQRLD